MPRISPADRTICINRYVAGESSLELGKAFGLSGNAVRGLVKRAGHTVRSLVDAARTHSLDHRYFAEIDREDSAYWLGFLLADGGVYKNSITLALGQVDSEHILRFRDAIGSNHKPFYRPRIAGKHNGIVGLTMRSKEMADDLARYGIVPCKSMIASAPRLPTGIQRHFWRGVLDGDGSITTTTGRWRVRLYGSEAVCRTFSEWVLDTCGVPVRVAPHRSIWEARVEGLERSRLVLLALYDGATIFLPRKSERVAKVTTAAVNISRLGSRHAAERRAALVS